ncbi:coiled-coil domain-containing protein 66 isoform X3 [Amphiprion ocellaris]|uniref:CCDC66 domain-containing protein n=1 Tax=Amphiprion ocellaris TaxID=80972 RepID=A0A3Q1BH12_AMPOC|nr:coiled-coil domain-containing protein 66 isoform X3 [Amphiprion ocellaris]
MNIGDGLLFELENGKPRLILLSHGAEKNAAKQPSFRPRAANILSSRQPSCVEEVHGEERRPRQPAGRYQEARSKARRAAASFSSNITTAEGRSTTLTLSKTNDHHKGGSSKAVAKVKPDRQKHSGTVGPLRVDGKTGPAQNVRTGGGGKAGLKEALTSLDAGLKENMVCLTSEQLQQILNTVQTSSNGQHLPDDHQGPGNQTQNSNCGPSMTEGEGGEMEKEDGGREEELQKGGGEDEAQEKDRRLSGCLFSWMESDSRVAVDAKKAQWKKELDEQVALKQQQQCSAPARLQAEEDADSVLSVQSYVSHREQPAAIRSSLRLGEVTPMEEALSVERKEEQRRRWLEELDHQREETTERRRREKLLQSQTQDVALWATHFDSLQRRPLVHPAAPSAPTPAQFSNCERGEWEPSSLSLLWEAMSSCGAESVGRVSVDPVSGYPTRPSYLRTMTSLLDPAQIEEKERRRLKQLEQQRAIQAQMEERRQQRERDQVKRRQEEEAEERRVMLEREMLQRQYEMDTLREKQKEQPVHQAEQPKKGHDDGGLQETLEPSVPQQAGDLKDSAVAYKDSAVQTAHRTQRYSATAADAVLSLTADRVETPVVSAQYQLPPPPPPALPPPALPPPPLPPPPPTTTPNSKSRAARTEKENICLPAGGDPYEAFARRDKKRPEWNTQRPSRRFVPASERYPVALQRNRQESRLKRQAELLALQERTCLSRTGPPVQNQESGPCPKPSQTRTSPTRKVENDSSGQSNSTAVNTERGRSPPVPAVRHRVQSLQASTPPPPVLEFVPYVRTDEVFNMDPLEPAGTPPPQAHTGAPPARQSAASPPAAPHRDPLLHPELLRPSHTQRQQEILRGLAQLRQGLLQKQRELETDLNPLLKRHDNPRWSPSTTHRM